MFHIDIRVPYKIDSDSVEASFDTGCSTSISFEINSIVDYKLIKGKAEGLGINNIVVTGTSKIHCVR